MQEAHIYYTVEEYWTLVETFPEKRLEYIDGQVRDIRVLNMSGGSNNHSLIGTNLSRFVSNRLDACGSECLVYNSDVKVQLSESRYYHPDLAVSCDPYDWRRQKQIEAPTLVVEVLSPRTESVDRHEKLNAYKNYPTIQEILLVDSREVHVVHYSRLGESTWKETVYTHADDVISLEHLEIQIPLSEIYYRIDFEETHE